VLLLEGGGNFQEVAPSARTLGYYRYNLDENHRTSGSCFLSPLLPGHEVSTPAMMCCLTTEPKTMRPIDYGLIIPNYKPKQTFSLCKLIVLGVLLYDRKMTNILPSSYEDIIDLH
jgi:hypothetical protein